MKLDAPLEGSSAEWPGATIGCVQTACAAESAKHIAWTRAFYDAIEPHAHGSHLLNFNSEASDAEVQASFGEHYARLAEVKRLYDPTNFFSQDLNLRAAAA